ncbi:MAG: PEP/pyruvate-binding domain-containing protein [Elusimicrobiota bacterium]
MFLCCVLLIAPVLLSAQVVPVPVAPANGAAASGWAAVVRVHPDWDPPPAFSRLDLTQRDTREALIRILDKTSEKPPQDRVELYYEKFSRQMTISLTAEAYKVIGLAEAFNISPLALSREKTAELTAGLADLVKIHAVFDPECQVELQAAARILSKTAIPDAKQLASFKEAEKWATDPHESVLIRLKPSPRRWGLKAPESGNLEKGSPADPELMERAAVSMLEKDLLGLLADDNLKGRLDAIRTVLKLNSLRPVDKDRLREVFRTTSDRRLKGLLGVLFFNETAGPPMASGFLAWLYREDFQQIMEVAPGILAQEATVDLFTDSIFTDPGRIPAWAEKLRKMKSELFPDVFTRMKEAFAEFYPNPEDAYEFFRDSMFQDPQLFQDWSENILRAKSELSPEAYAKMKKTFRHGSDAVNFFYPVRDIELSVKEGEYSLPYSLESSSRHKGKQPAAASDFSQLIQNAAKDQKSLDKLRAKHALFDRLINANYQTLESMSSQAESLTRSAGKLLLSQTQRMEDLYHRLRGDSSAQAEHSRTQKAYERIQEKLRRRWRSLSPDEKLPQRPMDIVLKLDPKKPLRSLNSLINWMHQKALMLFGGHSVDGDEASGRITLSGGYQLPFIYLGQAPLREVLRRNQVLRAFQAEAKTINGLSSSDDLIFDEHRIWLSLHLGCHSAELSADSAPPDEGGMLRIRYKESSDDGHQYRIRMIATFLEKLGMSVKVEDESYLDAVLDKDHGLDSERAIAEIYPLIVRLLYSTHNMDLNLDYIAGSQGDEKTKEFASQLGELFLSEGKWPFYAGSSSMYNAHKKYLAQAEQRQALAAKLNAELGRLGLAPMPADIPLGQRAIDLYFTKPIAQAAARGELDWDGQGRPKKRAYAPLDELAKEASSKPVESARLASILSSLDDSLLAYGPIGQVGALSAERGQKTFEDGSYLTVHVLRDPASGSLAYAKASLWSAAQGLKFLEPAELRAFLHDEDLSAQQGDELSVPQQSRLNTLLRLRIPEQSGVEQAQVYGLPASPGKGRFSTGPLFFDKTKLKEGAVLAVPYTSPDDIEAISKSAGVITTGGGSLSHAAITTRELGLPSVILPTARWRKDAANSEKPSLEAALTRRKQSRVVGEGIHVAELSADADPTLREGDLVRIYGKEGKVALIAGAGDAAMQKAYAALEAFRVGPAAGLQWDADWDERVERFFLEEACSNPLYADSILKPLILDALRKNAKHLTAAEVSDYVSAAAGPDDASSQAAGNDSTQPSGASETAARKPLWLRLEKKLGQTANKDRLMALLRRMIRRDGAKAGEYPAYRRLAALDRAAREKTLSEKTAKEPAFLDLEQIDDDMKPLVGGKSAKLGEMLQALAFVAPAKAGAQGGVHLDPGLRRDDGASAALASVPEGLALTIYAYKRFLKETGLEDKVRALAMELDALLNAPNMDEASRSKEISRLSERIRQVLMSAKLDAKKGVGSEILKALKKHGFADQSARWSVRSSAIQEDSDDAAFAGAAESYLNLKPDEVLSKVVENWASFWLPRGILYRQKQGLRSVDLLPATLIQKMAPAVVSGVIFTRNPVNGKDEVVLNAAYGLGEGVVSGQTAADVYMTRKWDGQETELPHIARKRWRVENRPEGFGTRLGPVPAELRGLRALSVEQTRRLTRVAVALEKRFGKAMDIEFSLLADGTIVILQARPITTH